MSLEVSSFDIQQPRASYYPLEKNQPCKDLPFSLFRSRWGYLHSKQLYVLPNWIAIDFAGKVQKYSICPSDRAKDSRTIDFVMINAVGFTTKGYTSGVMC